MSELVIRVRVSMTAEQERRYRAEHGLSATEPLRPHLLDRLHRELAGEDALNDWWTVQLS